MTAAGDILGGKYQLLRLLGEGGMGQVFEAINQNTDRRVAIKTLHPEWTREPAVVQRFLREARAATKINHPNVVDVLDLDTDAATGAPYIVQEFLAGESLESHLAARPDKRLPVADALRILVPVMEALVAAHKLGIVHRDLKPANLFLSIDRGATPTPKVIDFGIAKLMETKADAVRQTAAGTLVGTPSYMSPEQAAGAADIDARTDVWSLGVVLYELLSGALPYDAPNYNLLVAKIVYEAPVPVLQQAPSLPRDVAAIVDRALLKDRDARYPSMQAMLDATLACAAWAATSPTPSSAPSINPTVAPGVPAQRLSAPPSSPPSLAAWSAQPPSPPRRTALTALAALVVAALVGVASFLSFRDKPVATVVAAPASRPAPLPVTAVIVAPPQPVAAPPQPVAAPPAVEPVAEPVVAPAPTPPPAAVRRSVVPARPRPPRAPRPPSSHDFDRGYPE